MDSNVAQVVRDPRRLAALHELGLLDTPAEQAFDRLAKLAARILHTPVALVSLVDSDRQFFKSCLGLPEPWSRWRETPLSHSFCQHVVASGKPLVIPDARRDPALLDNLAIRDLNVIAYLGSPLILPGGQVIGSFCVIDTKPHAWTDEEISIVRDLAASVMTEINLRHLHDSLQEQAAAQAAAMTATLRESESLYRELNDLAADGIFISDASGRFIEVNPAGCALSGYTRAELLRRGINDLIPPEDRLLDPPRLDELRAGKTVNRERRLLRKDGAIVMVESSAKLLPGGRIQGIVRDITEHKRAEDALRERDEVLRLFVEHSPAAIAMFDNEMRYVVVSRRWLTDYDLGDCDIIGRSHYEIFPEIPQRWRDIHQRCLAGATERCDEDPFVRADGHTDWVRWEIRPWRKADGGIGGIIVFSELITGRKQAEAEREKLLVELTARNLEMENFVYTISHDLKTPLITIGGFASLLSKDLAKKDLKTAHDSLAEIDKAVEQMKGHIEDLLMLSRTGRVAAEKIPIDLGELVGSVLKMFAQQIRETRAKIHVAADLPVIMADPEGLRRVFTNLIDNALKYRREDASPVIEIGAARTDDAIGFFVRDNGTGIRARYREHIFELFQRADSKTEGTGVGLAIARRVIEVHGGRMWVDSKTGQGSTFWIELPASVIVSSASKSA